jgi:CheY-like chemotaxis protein/anti-sigma regulatory factor (Ser/Thr protein kinase)
LGDELRVKQILNNLLSNAVKYTHKGTVTLNVTWEKITHSPPPSVLLRFVIRDTGIGIRNEDMEKLFSSYVQVDARANRAIEGTGLGLEITKNLVEMMGGSISAESEYGKGSAFTVTLVQGLADPGGIGETIAEDLRNFRYVGSRKQADIVPTLMPYGKVLIVDDVPVNIMVVEGLLEPYGLQVESATSGLKAIEKVCSWASQYDLIFMDHLMPEMDGIEATKLIRAWENEQQEMANNGEAAKQTKIPIIALTANALAGNMEMFLSAGFDGFISKPIDIAEVDAALNKWIRVKKK